MIQWDSLITCQRDCGWRPYPLAGRMGRAKQALRGLRFRSTLQAIRL